MSQQMKYMKSPLTTVFHDFLNSTDTCFHVLHEVLQLPSNMLRVPQPVGTTVPSVPTMGYGFADPRDLRQRSSDLCLGSDMSFGNNFGRGGLEESQKFPIPFTSTFCTMEKK